MKIAVLDSTLENATRRMELIHKRIDRTEERVTKLNEDVRERIRALEKWVWGAGAVLTAFIVIGGGAIKLPSNFKWTPPTEDQLWNCTVTESAGTSEHWCENGYPDLCDC